jgi:hypothetical protein
VIVRVLALVWALLLCAHRDERGGFWSDLFSGIGGSLKDIVTWVRDRLRELQDALWERLGHLGQTVWNGFVDVGNKLYAVIANAAAAVRDRLRQVQDALWERLGHLGQTLWDAGVDVSNKLWGVIAQGANIVWDALRLASDKIWGAIAAAAAAIRDVLIAIGAGLRDAVVAGANRVGDAGERVADVAEEIPGAIKEAAAESAEAAGSVIERLLDLGPDIADTLTQLNQRVLRGEITSYDEWLGQLEAGAPHTSLMDKFWYYALSIPTLAAWAAAGGAVRAEPAIQELRRLKGVTLMDAEDLRDASLRALVDDAFVHDQLARAGFSDRHIEAITKLWQIIPPPSDLIRMAVREAFSPDIVARFGQHQDFPEEFARLAEQQGISREFALAYWAAHWGLPSATQGFEMLHRDVINREDLNLLLRALDVMPFWREKLTEIAYNVVTRVDTRRLFASGVWDRTRVLRSYLDQGYNPADAEALTAWTVQEYGDTAVGARDLTRSAVEKAYRQGRITRDQAIGRLVELDYDEDEADFFLSNVDVDIDEQRARDAERDTRELTQGVVLRAYRDRVIPNAEASALLADLGYDDDQVSILLAVQDFDVESDLANLRARVVEQDFKHARISDGEAMTRLAGAGINADRADLMVQRWVAQQTEKPRELTVAQLGQALDRELVDDVAYTERVIALGYNEDDAIILLGLRGRATSDQVRELTTSSVISAYRREVLSRETTRARLLALGYTGDDAEILLRTADAAAAAAAARQGA